MTSEVETTRGRPETIRAVPVRHPWRWVAVVVIAVLVAMFAHMLVANPNIHWSVVRKNLFNSLILQGVRMTLELTVISMAVGIVLGVVAAVMRLSRNPIVSGVAWVYVWFFRGTPLLVQIFFWFAFSTFVRNIAFGIPFGPHFDGADSNKVVTLFISGILALALNEGAYMSEIVRAGIVSVDEGQTEAAHALGMTRLQTMWRVVLPQAMRVIIPPTGNEVNSMLKNTSLVSVAGLIDLLAAAQHIYYKNYRIVELLIVASIWYLAMTSAWQIVQYYIERYYGRGSARATPLTPMQRARMLAARGGHYQ